MKKRLSICFALCVLVVSCTDDYKDMIVGTWNFESVTQRSMIEGVQSEHTFFADRDTISKITFKGDGSLSGNWCGVNTQVVGPNEEYVLAVTQLYWNHYDISEERIIFKDDRGHSDKYIIKSLTKSKMVFLSPSYDITLFDSSETGLNGTMQMIYTLKKK